LLDIIIFPYNAVTKTTRESRGKRKTLQDHSEKLRNAQAKTRKVPEPSRFVDAVVTAATAKREKDAQAFAETSAEDKAVVEGLKKAIASIGSGTFLQTDFAAILQKLLEEDSIAAKKVDGDAKQTILSYLADGHSDVSKVVRRGCRVYR